MVVKVYHTDENNRQRVIGSHVIDAKTCKSWVANGRFEGVVPIEDGDVTGSEVGGRSDVSVGNVQLFVKFHAIKHRKSTETQKPLMAGGEYTTKESQDTVGGQSSNSRLGSKVPFSDGSRSPSSSFYVSKESTLPKDNPNKSCSHVPRSVGDSSPTKPGHMLSRHNSLINRTAGRMLGVGSSGRRGAFVRRIQSELSLHQMGEGSLVPEPSALFSEKDKRMIFEGMTD